MDVGHWMGTVAGMPPMIVVVVVVVVVVEGKEVCVGMSTGAVLGIKAVETSGREVLRALVLPGGVVGGVTKLLSPMSFPVSPPSFAFSSPSTLSVVVVLVDVQT